LESPFGWILYLYYFLAEYKEQENPKKYGRRVEYRRIFLIGGTGFLTYIVYNAWITYPENEGKELFLNLINELGIELMWPQNGTIFDDVFVVYDEAHFYDFIFLLSACILLWIAIIFELSRTKIGLVISSYLVELAIIFLFGSAIIFDLPNYLEASNVSSIFPSCGAQFDEMIKMTLGNIVGIICTNNITISLLPILCAIPPSLVRAATLIISTNSQDLDDDEKNLNIKMAKTVYWLSSILSPIITSLGLVFVIQVTNDIYFSLLLLGFVILPLVVTYFTPRVNMYYYIMWLCAYLGCLAGMILYEILKYEF
jgi:hypothetical protein